MIRCIVDRCQWTGHSYDSLYGHLKRMHSKLLGYKCNVDTCDRTYSSIATFRFQWNEMTINDNLHVLTNILQFHSKPINLHIVNNKLFFRAPNYYDCNSDI